MTLRWRPGIALVVALSLCTMALAADELQERRTHAALRLFRSLLAADLDLQSKSSDGALLILFVYKSDRAGAQALVRSMQPPSPDAEAIRGIPITSDAASDTALLAGGTRKPAAIFISQPLDRQSLREVVRYGIEQRIIVYSPFEGDVERGVTGGLSIEAQVRPYVNATTLAASHISLKEFFMKVTRVYR